MLNGILDYIKRTISDIRERIQNPFTDSNSTPFAGAFLIALILYNWQLFFSLFSFDSNETRLTKISIINDYLIRETLLSRIGYPIAIAFGSIVFYYIFNNLSLGLTTIFNRWFKSTVLHFTDRSKIVTREELERVNSRANSSKKNYERIKSELSKSENERGNLDKQLNELSGKYDIVASENQRLRKDAESTTTTTTTTTTQPPREQFRIIYARYGAEETFNDVTEIVKKIVKSSGRFTVDNKMLEGDPVVYSIKNLFVVYEHNNETNSITSNEAEIVELRDGKLVTIQTELSKRKQNYLKNQEKIGDIFSGLWILTFTINNVSNSEPVFIDKGGRYFAHSKHTFYLRTINIDEAGKKITFNKVDLQRKLHAKEILTIQDSDLITGTDSKGYSLEYKRQKEI